MTLRRRTLLAAALATPAISRGAETSVLKFVPQADLSILDPVWTSAYVTRNHGMMVFDTLYGMDSAYAISPQMAAGHVIDDDGLTWTLTLRDGLAFHDGSPVLARDCVASIRRWAARDERAVRAGRPPPALPPETSVPAAARRPGQARIQHLRDHAGTPGLDRSVQADHRDDRQRPVPLPGRSARRRRPRRL
jgi:ABC-type transport system substrate-binding protein